MYLSILWLVLIVAAIVVEALTSQMISIWFVIGGIAALIANICDAPFLVQFALYILVTALALAVSRPFVKRTMKFRKESTNADRYIGKTGVVTLRVDNTAAEGQVKVMGNIWSARSSDGTVIPEGQNVEVLRIEGVKLIVAAK